MAALYRKYRPQTFEDVVGQEAVVRTLSNALTAGKVRQAYLFAGPRGTGKTSLARILAKSVNCVHGPTPTPDNTCHACVAIANGSSLDVIEMDAASQRGIDDIRDIRDRVVLQPVEGRSKVYILDEAHQLTDAAWNALLKLLRRVADGEGMEAPDAALALVARSARGSFRDAVSTLDQLASATGGQITVQDVLQLLGAVEEEVLFRLCDLVVEGNAAGALVFLEELSEQGQDLGRLVIELLDHLRALMLVQHTGEVPDSLPVTEETRGRLREQANQLGPGVVLRLIDLLHVAVDDMRQGADPRLPLELALVKVTRPNADLSRESLAFRVERLEQGHVHPAPAPPIAPGPPSNSLVLDEDDEPAAEAPSLELEQLQDAWRRSILPAVRERSIPTEVMLGDAHPAALEADVLTLEFPAAAGFLRTQAEDPKNSTVLQEALYAVTGRRLTLAFAVGPDRDPVSTEHEHPATEEEIVELMKSTFDAREVET